MFWRYKIELSITMSFTSNEDIPKLKGTRFSKFKPSALTTQRAEEKYVAKQGFKRTISDDDEPTCFKRQKPCTTSNRNEQVSTAKNLANSRLKKLKESIQAEVQSRNAEVQSRNADSNSLSSRGLTRNPKQQKGLLKSGVDAEEHPVQHQAKYVKQKDNNICQTTKNFANKRLQNIRKLNNPQDDKNVTVPSNKGHPENRFTVDSPQTSRLKINKENVTGAYKRNINDTGSEVFGNSRVCKILAIAQNKPSYENIKTKTNVCSSTLADNRGKISEQTPVVQNIFNNESCVSKSVSKSDTNFENVKQSAALEIMSTKSDNKIENDKSEIKSPSIPLDANTSHRENADLPASWENHGSFSDKMAMTASWIIHHHQDVNNVMNSSAETSANSLQVNVDTSASRINFANETEDMEWTNAEPDDQVVNLSTQEATVSTEQHRIDHEEAENKRDHKESQQKLKDICVVVDTNVFISGLSKIQDIMNMKVTEPCQPVIYIPWMVLMELDYMKDQCSDGKLKKNITNSVKFIHNALEQKNPRMLGQTVDEAEKQKYIGKSPDDKILSCCLQAGERYEHVILVSNDVNLKNKAMVNDVTVCSTNEVIMKIMSKLSNSNKFKKVSHKMGIMCSTIICDCAKEAYGDVWIKMDMLHCPPWSLLECLKRFKKYWNAVFREKLLKQFTRTMDELLDLLESNKYISDNSSEFVTFTKLCLNLCIFLKDIEECRALVENTLKDITQVA